MLNAKNPLPEASSEMRQSLAKIFPEQEHPILLPNKFYLIF